MSVPKKIYDSVHGFIHLSAIESQLLDSALFQRLHYIRQLGSAYLVYPGAVHTRFEHSLGVLKIATQVFDTLAVKQLFPLCEKEIAYWRAIVRMAALCHDLGHLPFSHVAEKQLLGKGGHEEWTLRAIKSQELQPIWSRLADLLPGRNSAEDLLKVAIGEEKLSLLFPEGSPFTPWERIFSEIITGDFFGADRIDYLLRDAKYTGLSYGLFDYHQLIEMLTILPNTTVRGGEGEKREIAIEENGLESCEALLLARHFMYKRLYEYPSVKAYAFHLSRFMQSYYNRFSIINNIERYLSITDNEILAQLQLEAKDPDAPAHLDASVIYTRKKKFQAIPLEESLDKKKLIAFKETHHIPDQAIFWEFASPKKGDANLSFPVLLKSGGCVPAQKLSPFFILSRPSGWIYLSQEYRFLV